MADLGGYGGVGRAAPHCCVAGRLCTPAIPAGRKDRICAEVGAGLPAGSAGDGGRAAAGDYVRARQPVDLRRAARWQGALRERDGRAGRARIIYGLSGRQRGGSLPLRSWSEPGGGARVGFARRGVHYFARIGAVHFGCGDAGGRGPGAGGRVRWTACGSIAGKLVGCVSSHAAGALRAV